MALSVVDLGMGVSPSSPLWVWAAMTSLALGAFGVSWVVAAWVRHHALALGLMDRPNERSLHLQPTPRGGGLGVVLAFCLPLPLLILFPDLLPAIPLSGEQVVVLLLACVMVAGVGLRDDYRSVGAGWRLIVQVVAATGIWLVLVPMPAVVPVAVPWHVPVVPTAEHSISMTWLFWDTLPWELGPWELGPWELGPWEIGPWEIKPEGVQGAYWAAAVGWMVATGLGVLALVWAINLYNFMDGMDGLAGAQAVFLGFAGAALAAGLGFFDVVPMPFLLASATLGFLVWNLPPARIFMGDVGSGFLGLVFGFLVLQAAVMAPILFWVWLILGGVFVVDSTYTLLSRLLTGQNILTAHRSHAYQRATRRLGGHAPVLLTITLINLFWLLPLAVLVGARWLNGVWGVLLAYLPLVVVAVMLKAGQPERAECV